MSSKPNLLTPFLAVAAAGQPELALLAAIVRVAVEDARRGDPDARAWLAGAACLVVLGWIAPANVAPEQVQARILARLPAPQPWQPTLDLDEADPAGGPA